MTVTESDAARSAFTITLDAGRSGPDGRLRHPAAHDVAAAGRMPGSCLLLTMGALPQVLLDGIVTETELTPGERRRSTPSCG